MLKNKYMDPLADPKERAEALLSEMSLDEKMAHGYYGVDVIVYDELQRPEQVDNDVIRGLIASLQLN